MGLSPDGNNEKTMLLITPWQNVVCQNLCCSILVNPLRSFNRLIHNALPAARFGDFLVFVIFIYIKS